MENHKRNKLGRFEKTDDDAYDTWIGNNRDDLVADFIDTYNSERISFCRERWEEE